MDEALFAMIAADAVNVLTLADKLDIKVPAWATCCIIGRRHEALSLYVRFFEDVEDLFDSYTRVCIKRKADLSVACAKKDDITDTWKRFTAPTLIGPKLETRLREGL